jgi:hypothetical protein
MRLFGHIRFAKTRDDFQTVTARIEILRQQANFGFLAADDKPRKNE